MDAASVSSRMTFEGGLPFDKSESSCDSAYKSMTHTFTDLSLVVDDKTLIVEVSPYLVLRAAAPYPTTTRISSLAPLTNHWHTPLFPVALTVKEESICSVALPHPFSVPKSSINRISVFYLPPNSSHWILHSSTASFTLGLPGNYLPITTPSPIKRRVQIADSSATPPGSPISITDNISLTLFHPQTVKTKLYFQCFDAFEQYPNLTVALPVVEINSDYQFDALDDGQLPKLSFTIPTTPGEIVILTKANISTPTWTPIPFKAADAMKLGYTQLVVSPPHFSLFALLASSITSLCSSPFISPPIPFYAYLKVTPFSGSKFLLQVCISKNQNVRYGSSIDSGFTLIKSGDISVTLKSKFCDADADAEEYELTKVQNFNQIDLVFQFALRFITEPPGQGPIGKVLIDRVGKARTDQVFELFLSQETNPDLHHERWRTCLLHELANLLEIPNNWKILATELGLFSKKERKEFKNSSSPFMSLFEAYLERSGDPEKFIKSLYQTHRVINRPYVVSPDSKPPPLKRIKIVDPSSSSNRPLPIHLLWSISTHLPKSLPEITSVARNLSILDESKLSQLSTLAPRDCAYQILVQWKEQFPSQCNLATLIAALQEDRLFNIANTIEETANNFFSEQQGDNKA